MQLHGQQLIGDKFTGTGASLRAVNPITSRPLEPAFCEAGPRDVDMSLRAAESAFEAYRHLPAARRAAFLNAIAKKMDADDTILSRAAEETGLSLEGRLRGERARATSQLRLFANLIEEGSWVDARIDKADPSRKPFAKPDLRRMLVPIGPVVVFAASNFPIAFSVAGGDAASALAAGCPIVVKAHPGHPGTSEIVGRIIADAARETGMPAGVFSLLHGRSHELGKALVQHPLTKAVGFTGSIKAGRALFNAAGARPEPIPVYAEMGSTNPIFLLPGALAQGSRQIAEGLKFSVTLGAGQFCTNPGIIAALDDAATQDFVGTLASLFAGAPCGTMLYPALRDAYNAGAERFAAVPGVTTVSAAATADPAMTQAQPHLFITTIQTYLSNPALREELFGPSTVVLQGSREELLKLAASLDGQLTATVFGAGADLASHRDLLTLLERKVGRLLFNSFPTGVEVSPAMQHGGPYPSTTDSRTTSVGTAAIERFARPICYQDFPDESLPEELRAGNPRKIWRLVNGERTRD